MLLFCNFKINAYKFNTLNINFLLLKQLNCSYVIKLVIIKTNNYEPLSKENKILSNSA